jgi:glucokinase
MISHEFDVFLSYSSRDEATARLIHEHLSGKGYEVWLDRIEVVTGDDIVQKVFDGIRKSRYFAILLSNSSTQSTWVREELSAARIRELEEERVVVIPLLYEDCRIPDSLSSKRYADFRHSIQEGLEELVHSLRRHGERESREGISIPLTETEAPSSFEQNRDRLVDAVSGNEKLYLVIDLGGTKAYVSLMNGQAERFFDRKFATESHEDPNRLFDFIKRCIRGTIDGIHEICDISTDDIFSRIEAFGIGFAGPTDADRGLVLDAPNFTIRNFPLADKLGRTFNIPAYVENDVNLGVLGESWKGVAKGYKNVVGIIIGTGIGGGIMIDGQVFRGRNKTAGEIGHMVIDHDSSERCGCGQYGCLEALASRSSMARDLHRTKSSKGMDNLIWEERNLGSNELAHYFESGDEDAIEVVNNAARICGKAVFSILNLLNPDIIFFGGGFVRQLGDVFLEPVREEAQKCMNAVYSLGEKNIPIEVGVLDNPILVGACKMVIDNTIGRKEHSRSSIIDAIIGGLEESHLKLLHSFFQTGMPIPISKDPRSDFHEDRLRELRNRGLIRTSEGQSFRRSANVQITELGRFIAEETM